MGKPGWSNVQSLLTEFIGYQRERGELKHLSTRRSRKKLSIFLVVASERERAQTEDYGLRGCG